MLRTTRSPSAMLPCPAQSRFPFLRNGSRAKPVKIDTAIDDRDPRGIGTVPLRNEFGGVLGIRDDRVGAGHDGIVEALQFPVLRIDAVIGRYPRRSGPAACQQCRPGRRAAARMDHIDTGIANKGRNSSGIGEDRDGIARGKRQLDVFAPGVGELWPPSGHRRLRQLTCDPRRQGPC